MLSSSTTRSAVGSSRSLCPCERIFLPSIETGTGASVAGYIVDGVTAAKRSADGPASAADAFHRRRTHAGFSAGQASLRCADVCIFLVGVGNVRSVCSRDVMSGKALAPVTGWCVDELGDHRAIEKIRGEGRD